ATNDDVRGCNGSALFPYPVVRRPGTEPDEQDHQDPGVAGKRSARVELLHHRRQPNCPGGSARQGSPPGLGDGDALGSARFVRGAHRGPGDPGAPDATSLIATGQRLGTRVRGPSAGTLPPAGNESPDPP